MNIYRIRYIDKARVVCISRIEGSSFDDAINTAKKDYGAITILECGLFRGRENDTIKAG